MSDKIKTADLEAERKLLSACLSDVTAISIAVELDPGDMYDARHGRIMAACISLFRRSRPVEPVSVQSELRQSGKDDGANGMKYMLLLVSECGLHWGVAGYMETIQRYARIRRAFAHQAKATQSLSAGDLDKVEDHMTRAGAAVVGVDVRFRVERLGSVVEGVIEALASAQSSRKTEIGFRTGVTDIDSIRYGHRGLHRKRVTVLCARPSVGKTALALQIAYNVAKSGGPVLYACSEMSKRDLTLRIIARVARVDYARTQAGNLSPDELVRVRGVYGELARIPLYIYDKGSVTVPHLIAKSREVAVLAGAPIAQIVVDHMSRMNCDVKFTGGNIKYQEASHNIKALQAACVSEDCNVLALVQLNRKLESRENKRPIQSDLRSAGEIEEEAAEIITIFRPHVHDTEAPEHIAEVAFAKARFGRLCTIHMHWDGALQTFSDAAPQNRDYMSH